MGSSVRAFVMVLGTASAMERKEEFVSVLATAPAKVVATGQR